MMRNGGAPKFSLQALSTKEGISRPLARAEPLRRSGASLSQLENVLQQLNKHDERTQLQSVERTSAQTQHKLLKDELLKAQEELALVHSGKNKLCEQIGALQQAKQAQQTQIEHLLVELRSSHESQAAMAKKTAELERHSEDLKRNYIRSLTYRTKTASELLSKLCHGGAFDGASGMASSMRISEGWIASDPSKRKRIEAEAVEVEGSPVEDDPMAGQDTDQQSEQPVAVEAPTGSEYPNAMHEAVEISTDSNTSSPQEEQQESSPTPLVHRDCQSCLDLTVQNANLKEDIEKKVEMITIELKKEQDRSSELAQLHDAAKTKLSVLQSEISEKDEAIADLKSELLVEREKMAAALQTIQESANAKDNSADGEPGTRIKVLEDNLAQLNTYADHLEMLIGQCASCSVKLQSENTQESAK